MKALEVGTDIDFANTDRVTKLVKVGLPHQGWSKFRGREQATVRTCS